MSIMMRLFAAPLIALCIAAPAAADTASARGMASVQYAGKKVQASDKERALAAGKFNAVERVRRQKFWDSRAADLVEGWPRLGLRFRRRFCGAASADVRGSGA